MAGCTPSQSSSGTSPPPASSATTASTTSTSPLPSTLAHCQASDLVGSVSGQQGAAGTVEVTVELRNVSIAPCAVEGFPGAQLTDAGGNELPTGVVRGGSFAFTDFAPAPLTLPAGAAGYFNLGYSDVTTGSAPCEAAAALWVTPPDDVEQLTISQSMSVCDGGRLTVSPVFGTGTAQTQTTAPAAQAAAQ